jgi:hypothetical protein
MTESMNCAFRTASGSKANWARPWALVGELVAEVHRATGGGGGEQPLHRLLHLVSRHQQVGHAVSRRAGGRIDEAVALRAENLDVDVSEQLRTVRRHAAHHYGEAEQAAGPGRTGGGQAHLHQIGRHHARGTGVGVGIAHHADQASRPQSAGADLHPVHPGVWRARRE